MFMLTRKITDFKGKLRSYDEQFNCPFKQNDLVNKCYLFRCF